MERKLSKEARDYVLTTITENGSMSTDEIVEIVRPHYMFNPRTAREREIRRYVSQLVRGSRDEQGVRTMFLEKTRSEVVHLDTCEDATRVTLVAAQLEVQSKGIYRSFRKAAKRKHELNGQMSMFDEAALLRDLSGAY